MPHPAAAGPHWFAGAREESCRELGEGPRGSIAASAEEVPPGKRPRAEELAGEQCRGRRVELWLGGQNARHSSSKNSSEIWRQETNLQMPKV